MGGQQQSRRPWSAASGAGVRLRGPVVEARGLELRRAPLRPRDVAVEHDPVADLAARQRL
jgi:hypothetical protein